MNHEIQTATQQPAPAAFRAVVQGERCQGPIAAGNFVDYSSYRRAEGHFSNSGLAIKYAIRGTENYVLDGRETSLRSGHFLLSTAAEGAIRIDSPTPVEGLCIDLDAATLAQIGHPLSDPDGACDASGSARRSSHPDFSALLYHHSSSALGAFLCRLAARIHADPFAGHRFGPAFFVELGALVIAELEPARLRNESLSSLKPATRAELLHRLQTGKAYLDEHFRSGVSLEYASRAALLSMYHFLRLFRTFYGITPHQYIISRRIDYARQRLLHSDEPVTGIAFEAGFSDLQSFSRAFRKSTGASPKQLRARGI